MIEAWCVHWLTEEPGAGKHLRIWAHHLGLGQIHRALGQSEMVGLSTEMFGRSAELTFALE